jgi:AcrR family transcriptional regulator
MKKEKADKRANILEAAEKLFSEVGYEGASTRQIAKEAGANMAMINYYFGSKEGVYVEIISQRIADFNNQLYEIKKAEVTVMEKLLLVIERYASQIIRNLTFHNMMQRELSLPQRPEMFTTIKSALKENMLVLENIITDGIEDGTFRRVDVPMLIATIMGTISNVAISPSNITYGTSLNVSVKNDRQLITEQLTTHLKDLITIYLSQK